MTLGNSGRADNIPERGLPGGRGDADAGRPAVHVVGDIDGFRMARQRFDAAQFRLREQRMIGQALILQQRASARPRRGGIPSASMGSMATFGST